MEKTLLVLDRGMMRPENLKELDRSGFDYVCRLKKGETAVKEVILEAGGLDEKGNRVWEDMSAVDMVREFAGGKRKLVVYKNHEQAKMMKECRDLKLAKALKGLEEYAARVNAGTTGMLKRSLSGCWSLRRVFPSTSGLISPLKGVG